MSTRYMALIAVVICLCMSLGAQTVSQHKDNAPKISFYYDAQTDFNKKALEEIKSRLDLPIEVIYKPAAELQNEPIMEIPWDETTLIRLNYYGEYVIDRDPPAYLTEWELQNVFRERIAHRERLNQVSGSDPKVMRFLVVIDENMTVEDAIRLVQNLLEAGAKDIMVNHTTPIEISIDIPIELDIATEENQENEIADLNESYLRSLASIESVGKASGNDFPPFNPVPYDDPPIPIGEIKPIYPEFFQRAKVQGTVVLEVDVYCDGSVGNIKVLRSVISGAGGLDEAAIDAVRKIKFIPGKSAGKPVDTHVIIPVEFRLGTPEK